MLMLGIFDQALINLRPGCQYCNTADDYTLLQWLPINDSLNLTLPTQDELNAEIARLQALQPAIYLQNAIIAKCKQVDKNRNDLKNQPISYTINNQNYNFQRDITSQLSFITASNTMDDSTPDTQWITQENEIVVLAKSDIIAICSLIRNRDTQLYLDGRVLKNNIAHLTAIDDINNFVITFN